MFHDIAYPLEIASGINLKYLNTMKTILSKFKENIKEFECEIIPKGFEDLEKEDNSFVLIDNCFDKYEINIKSKEIYQESIKLNNDKSYCHGILSSLTLMKLMKLYINEISEAINIEKCVLYFHF